MNAAARHERGKEIDRLLKQIGQLLHTRPFWTGETGVGMIKGAEYDRDGLRIEYVAKATNYDGRLRIGRPLSLRVRYNGDLVMSIDWDEKRERHIKMFEDGIWSSRLERLADAASPPRRPAPSQPATQAAGAS